MKKLKKYFNRSEPNLPVIVILLLALSLISIVLATGLGHVSVKPLNTAKILLSQSPGLGKLIPQT